MSEEYCICEWGPLGTGRMDSNKCPVHDMTIEELLEWGCLGWDTAEQLEAEIERLREAGNTLRAIAILYSDENIYRKPVDRWDALQESER